MKTTFTKAEIRKFLILYHGLNELDSFGSGKEGIINYFKRVCSIQMDPLDIVGINPELVLQSRFHDFSPKLLNELLYRDYVLVDGFNKEASIHLMEDWGKFTFVRQALVESHLRSLKYRGNENALVHLDTVLTHLKKHPNSSSKDIPLGSGKKDRWGSATIATCVLDHLWRQGQIGISSRKNKVKSYTDINKIITKKYKINPFPTQQEFLHWYIARRLDALGVYWLKRGPGWLGYHLNDISIIRDTINQLQIKKEIIEIQITDMKEKFYLTKKSYRFLISTLPKELQESLRFIAPLDNLIWDRSLVKELFQFEYTWDVYKPANQRNYGYYALPVLYKDQFIARIDPSRDKNRNNFFEIDQIWYEDPTYDNPLIKDLIKQELLRHNRSFSK